MNVNFNWGLLNQLPSNKSSQKYHKLVKNFLWNENKSKIKSMHYESNYLDVILYHWNTIHYHLSELLKESSQSDFFKNEGNFLFGGKLNGNPLS